ncbi:D-galactoside-specific lectin-like isoform X1 [Branchiostoma floridae x Branchiostoma belcheri]
MEEVSNLGTLNATDATSTASILAIINTTDTTNPPILGSINVTTNPFTLKMKACEKQVMQLACAADKQLMIDDAFYGRREKHPRCGCRWHRPCTNCRRRSSRPYTFVSERCQGLQQCEVRVGKKNFGDPCPYNKKYLDVTYRCKGGDKFLSLW